MRCTWRFWISAVQFWALQCSHKKEVNECFKGARKRHEARAKTGSIREATLQGPLCKIEISNRLWKPCPRHGTRCHRLLSAPLPSFVCCVCCTPLPLPSGWWHRSMTSGFAAAADVFAWRKVFLKEVTNKRTALRLQLTYQHGPGAVMLITAHRTCYTWK